LVQLSEQALRFDLFCKTILYQDKDTCAIRLGFGHLNEKEIEIIVKKKLKQHDLTKIN
jgi:GntR family transcriptional regulator/MocR family aminotransferase